jgi:hypothetical protein
MFARSNPRDRIGDGDFAGLQLLEDCGDRVGGHSSTLCDIPGISENLWDVIHAALLSAKPPSRG